MVGLTNAQKIKYKLLSSIDKKLFDDLLIKESIINNDIINCGNDVPCLFKFLPLAILYMKTRKKLVGLSFNDKVALKKLQAFNLMNLRRSKIHLKK